jgi:CRP-like cAMP-binding protein
MTMLQISPLQSSPLSLPVSALPSVLSTAVSQATVSPGAVSQAAPPTDPRQLLETLYRSRSTVAFQVGQTIPLEPDTLWVVGRGVVLLSTFYPSGDEALLGLAGPAMPFGLPLTLTQPYQATAMTDVLLIRLGMAEVEQSADLSQAILTHVVRRLRQTEALLAMAGYRRVEERLRQLLILLQMEVGQAVPEGTRIGVRLTHQHLASAIGTTRVTITRLLGQLRRDQQLQFDPARHLVIPTGVRL